jgi:hypothetical protein
MDQLVRYVNLESCSEIEAARKLLEFLMLTTTGRHPTLAQQKDRKAIDRVPYFLRTDFLTYCWKTVAEHSNINTLASGEFPDFPQRNSKHQPRSL